MAWAKADVKAKIHVNSVPPKIIVASYCNAVFFDGDYGLEQKLKQCYDVFVNQFGLSKEDVVEMWIENKVPHKVKWEMESADEN